MLFVTSPVTLSHEPQFVALRRWLQQRGFSSKLLVPAHFSGRNPSEPRCMPKRHTFWIQGCLLFFIHFWPAALSYFSLQTRDVDWWPYSLSRLWEYLSLLKIPIWFQYAFKLLLWLTLGWGFGDLLTRKMPFNYLYCSKELHWWIHRKVTYKQHHTPGVYLLVTHSRNIFCGGNRLLNALQLDVKTALKRKL